MSKTRLACWEDTYLFESHGKVLEINDVPEKQLSAIVLDSTIFYPQGGGQPADVGVINVDDKIFEVVDVRSDNTGKVSHFGKFKGEKFAVGSEASLSIDESKRRLHARIHSAGHLLDVAVQQLGLKLVPGKGYHFANGPYVEYAGDIPASDRDKVQVQIQDKMQELIKAGFEVLVEIVPYDQVGAKCGGVVPDYLASGEPARIVTVGGTVGCPCAGTHVKNVSEIGSVSVKKLTVKKNVVRVSYTVE